MIAVARATQIEQVSVIVPAHSQRICKGNDHRNMPIWGGRSRRALVRQAASADPRAGRLEDRGRIVVGPRPERDWPMGLRGEFSR
jgi:hypothetical protein